MAFSDHGRLQIRSTARLFVRKIAVLIATITAQDDGRLIGTISSPLSTEPKVGVLSSDGVSLYTADSDGSSVGRLIDDDHFELCYMQTSIADDQIVVSCVDYERAG